MGPYPKRVTSASVHRVAQLGYRRDDYLGRREVRVGVAGHLFCRVEDV
jgi:hypothetical protein